MTNKELVYLAIIHWRNYIQTGDPAISTETAVKAGIAEEKCRLLNSDQQEFIIRLEEVATAVLNGKLKIK